MSISRALPVAVLFALTGCIAGDDDESLALSSSAVSISAADAELVLNLCNYPGTDVTVLDEAVGLDRRAAENIVVHRDGPDGVTPSGDDDRFDGVAELDAISYVGESAFAKLQQYATEHPAPAGEHVEGVDFSGWQAEAVIWGVNQASLEELDDTLALDARAAADLVAGAPFDSVEAIGWASYVGESALSSLRAYAPHWWTAMQGTAPEPSLAGTYDDVVFDEDAATVALEIANLATHEQLVEHGMWSQGATAMVDSRPYTTLDGVAGVSGVGTATMQALHDYAVSGDWAPAVDPEDCSTNLTARVDANAADFDALLAAATTGDWPYAKVIALEVNSCISMDMSNERDAIIDAILESGVIEWTYGNALQLLKGDDFERGAGLFVTRMDWAKMAIEEAVQDGWTPSNATEAAQLAELDAMHTALTAGPRSAPMSYWIASLHIDAAECSEEAAILIDPSTNHIWIAHRLPGC